MKTKQIKISQKLKEIREQNNLNFSEMGKQLGISHTAIIRLESGLALPALPTLWKLWVTFGIKPEEILNLYDPKNTTHDEQTQESR